MDRAATPSNDRVDYQRIERHGPIEFRWYVGEDGDEEFDEFVIYSRGRCIAHGEALSDGAYWIGFYPTKDKSYALDLVARKRGTLDIHMEDQG